MKPTRKAATSALRMWGACQAVRYYTGKPNMEDARILEALHAEPRIMNEQGMARFHELTVSQILDDHPDSSSAIATTTRREVADRVKGSIKEGFQEGPRASQPYAGAALTSEGARETFLCVDMALHGAYRQLGFWRYVAEKNICDFRHPDVKNSYRLHDDMTSLIVATLGIHSAADVWAEELTKRLSKSTWESGHGLALEVLRELALMDERVLRVS